MPFFQANFETIVPCFRAFPENFIPDIYFSTDTFFPLSAPFLFPETHLHCRIRFYDIVNEKIRYNGINTNKIKKADLRHSL